MTTVQRLPASPVRSAGARVSRFTGIAFAVAFVAASVPLVTGPSVYEGGSLADYGAAHADDARMVPVAVSAFILTPVAAALLLWVVTFISGRLTGGDAAPGPGRVARLGAVAMAALLTAGAAAASAAQHLASGTGEGFPADPASGYAADLIGSQVQAIASWGGTVVLVGLGVAARRTGGLPGWLIWTGFVVAPLLVVSWVFFSLPTILFLVWLSVAGLVARPPSPVAAG